MLPHCQATTALDIGGSSTFCKNCVKVWGEYFLQFGVIGSVVYGILIRAHWALN